MLPMLEEAVRNLAHGVPRPKRGIPSGQWRHGKAGACGELDLFVTGTYLHGRPCVFFDARNEPIFATDFKGVFHLKHRPTWGQSHFDPDLEEPDGEGKPTGERPGDPRRRQRVFDRLARIARATSSLPVVFEPTTVPGSLMAGVIELPQGNGRDPRVYMGDGGYLNNRPLDLVLREIYRRPATAEVVRKVFLVEPDADPPLEPERADAPPPTAIQHYQKWKKIKSQQSMTDTLSELYQHNCRVRRVKEMLGQARARAEGKGASDEQLRLWQEIRLQELRDRVIGRWLEKRGIAGFGSVAHEDAEDALRTLPEKKREADALRLIRSDLLEHLERKYPRTLPGEDPVRLATPLDALDVPYLRRAISRVEEEIYLAAYGEECTLPRRSESTGRDWRLRLKVPHALNSFLRRLHLCHDLVDALEEAFDRVLAGAAGSKEYLAAIEACQKRKTELLTAVQVLWQRIATDLDYLLRSAVLGKDPSRRATEQVVHDLLREARERSYEITGSERRSRTEGESLVDWLRKEIAECVEGATGCLRRQIARDFDSQKRGEQAGLPLAWALGAASPAEVHFRLALLDAYLYPTERAADLPSLNYAELVYVSARSVQTGFSDVRASEKLAGEGLGHLAGFLKRSWRANDILWGRLDGAAAILDTLLDRDRLADLLRGDPEAAYAMLGAIDGYLLRGNCLFGEPAFGTTEDASLQKDDGGIGRHLRSIYTGPVEAGWKRNSIRDWLFRWAGIGPSPELDGRESYDADPDVGFRDLCECLLRRHQLEIIQEEVPQVLAEAMSEHAEWKGASDPGPFRQEPIRRSDYNHVTASMSGAERTLQEAAGSNPDGAVRGTLRLRAWEIARGLFSKRPGHVTPSQLADLFRTDYQVGREDPLKDIPPLVTAQRAVKLLLVGLGVLDRALPPEFHSSAAGKQLKRLILGPLGAVLGMFRTILEVLQQGNPAETALHSLTWGVMVLALLVRLSPPKDWSAANWLYGAGIGAFTVELLLSWLRGRLPRFARCVLLMVTPMFILLGLLHPPKLTAIAGLLTADLWWALADGMVIAAIAGVAALLAKYGRRSGTAWLSLIVTGAVMAGITCLVGLPAVRELWWGSSAPLRWCLLAAATTLFLMGAGLVQRTVAKLPAGASVAFEFVGDRVRAARMISSWSSGQRRAMRLSLRLDSWRLVPFYTLVLAIACTMAAHSIHESGSTMWWPRIPQFHQWFALVGIALSFAQILTAACDWCENWALAKMLPRNQKRHPAIDAAPPKVAYAATHLKWSLISWAFLYLFGSLLVTVVGALVRMAGH